MFKCEQNDCKSHSRGEVYSPFVPFPIRCHTTMTVSSDIRRESTVTRNTCPLSCRMWQAHRLPFSPTAQTAKNTGLTIKCCHWKKPRLLYSPKKLKENSQLKLKKILNDVLYVCGTSFREYAEEPVAYSRENIHCPTNIETPYYSIETLLKICICCGKLRKEMKEEMPDYYPQCTACTGPRIVNRKRKLVTEGTLKTSKKKK